MPTSREAAVRRAAILLASVPPELAEAMLQRLPSASAQRLRRAVAELTDIDPLERQRALESLRESLLQAPTPAGASSARHKVQPSDELRVSADGAAAELQARSATAASRPLDFLQDIDEAVLAGVLNDEHPRMVALVLCHLPPMQAARVLGGLVTEKRAEVVKRMASVGQIPPDVLGELTEHLQSLLPRLAPSPLPLGRPGATALLEISQHLEPGLRDELARMVAPADSALAATMHLTPARTPTTSPQPATPLRVVSDESADEAGDALPITFVHVEQLPTPALRRVFAEAEENLALLALSGCKPETAQRLLAGMPRRQAKLVQQQLAQIGPLTLRDIDRAQERMAEVAWALHQAGRLPELTTHPARRAA
jgi:flagellar motor switch protein FliG